MCWQRCFLLLVSRYTTAILWYILIFPTLNLSTLILPTHFYVGFECFESVGRVVLYQKQPSCGVDRYFKVQLFER